VATARTSLPNALTWVGSLTTTTSTGLPIRSRARSARLVTTREMTAVSTPVTTNATTAHTRLDHRRGARA
jgi:hypothetical protein